MFGGFGRGAGTRFGTDALTPSGPDDGSGWLSGFVDDLRSGRGGKKFEWGPEEEEFLGSEWVQKYGPHENIPVGELFPEGTPRMGRERPKDIIDDNQPMFTEEQQDRYNSLRSSGVGTAEADAEVRQEADIYIPSPDESAQQGRTYNTPRGGGMILDQDQTLNADVNLEANRAVIAERETAQAMEQWAGDGYGDTTITLGSNARLAKMNNNPGNIRWAEQYGAVEGEDGFAKWPTVEEGMQGLIRQIALDVGRGDSISTFISEYAPEADANDTKSYIAAALKHFGIEEDYFIGDLDINELAKFMAMMESGATFNSPSDTVEDGVV